MTAYDSLEYPSKPFLQCHPERLAVMGRLFGLATAAPASAKVLEVGCGDGLNLIAAALVLPDASFTGIDLSRAAVARGRKMIRALGLRNVRLRQEDLRNLSSWTFSTKARRFNYVVAHGVYSWVPAEIREALLGGMRHVLSETGVGFVSYNAYPGAYLRQMVREMVRGAGWQGEGEARVEEARERLTRLPGEASGSPLYRAILADECADMLRREDGALFHDDLAETNQPFYFREFVKQAATHDLRYLAEAELGPTAAWEGMDRLEAEQAVDFRNGRRFRQTLLCHAQSPQLQAPNPGALADCWVGGMVQVGNRQEEWVSAMGGRCKVTCDAERLFLETIASAWPEYISLRRFRRLLPFVTDLFAGNVVDVRTAPPPVSRQVAARPEVSPLARLQSALGMPLTNLHHFEVAVGSESLRDVLRLTDGTRTRAGLVRDLARLYPGEAKQQVALAVDTHLDDLRRYALLIRRKSLGVTALM